MSGPKWLYRRRATLELLRDAVEIGLIVAATAAVVTALARLWQ